MQAVFEPTGLTVLIAAATTAPSGTQIKNNLGDLNQGSGYMIFNQGSDTAFIGFGATGVASEPVIPGTGTPQAAYPVKPGDYLFLKTAPNQFISAIVKTTAGSVFVTPGRFLRL